MPERLHSSSENNNVLDVVSPGEGDHCAHCGAIACYFLRGKESSRDAFSITEKYDTAQGTILAVISRCGLDNNLGPYRGFRCEGSEKRMEAVCAVDDAGFGLVLALVAGEGF